MNQSNYCHFFRQVDEGEREGDILKSNRRERERERESSVIKIKTYCKTRKRRNGWKEILRDDKNGER